MITRTIRLYVALSEPYPDAPCNYYRREHSGRYRTLPAAQEQDYPDARYHPMRAIQNKTTPMLATITTIEPAPKDSRPKKPAPNAEANEAEGD